MFTQKPCAGCLQCTGNTTSSDCVENQASNRSEYQSQTSFNEWMIEELTTLKEDVSIENLQTLGTPVNNNYKLVNILQYLLNESKKQANNTTVNGETLSLNIDLKGLTGDCDSGSVNANTIVQLLVNEILSLRLKINQIQQQLV